MGDFPTKLSYYLNALESRRRFNLQDLSPLYPELSGANSVFNLHKSQKVSVYQLSGGDPYPKLLEGTQARS
jgi:hypothetical protein